MKITKRIFIIIAIVIISTLTIYQIYNTKKSHSPISFQPNNPSVFFPHTKHDFGEIFQGNKLKHSFQFYNKGKDYLEIGLRATCNCVRASLLNNRIAPGDSGKVTIELDSIKAKIGRSEQFILVRTNDHSNPIIKLNVLYKLKKYIYFQPSKIWLGEVAKNQIISRNVKLFIQKEKNIKIKDISLSSNIKSKIKKSKELSDNFEIKNIEFLINTGNYLGKFEKTITFSTNDSLFSNIPYRFIGRVIEDAKAIPLAIYLGKIEDNKLLEQEILIIPTNNKIIEISKIESTSQYIKTEFFKVENGVNYKLRTNINVKEIKKDAEVNESIRVYAKGQDYPIFIIPVIGKNKM